MYKNKNNSCKEGLFITYVAGLLEKSGVADTMAKVACRLYRKALEEAKLK